jgi:hypothetical protein
MPRAMSATSNRPRTRCDWSSITVKEIGGGQSRSAQATPDHDAGVAVVPLASISG